MTLKSIPFYYQDPNTLLVEYAIIKKRNSNIVDSQHTTYFCCLYKSKIMNGKHLNCKFTGKLNSFNPNPMSSNQKYKLRN